MRTLIGRVARRISREFENQYDRRQDQLQLGWVVGRWERRRRTRPTARSPLATGEPPPVSVLVATANRGLLLFARGQERQLLPGTFYGITRLGQDWYAFEKQRRHGRIIRFRLDGWWEVALWGLSRGVHQIDMLDGRLAVMDTYENRILLFDRPVALRDRWWRRARPTMHYPDGPLSVGRLSAPNYRHYNSIFRRDGWIYVIAHNMTSKTGRSSELWQLNPAFAVCAVRQLSASNAHNVYVDGHGEWYCASMEGTLRRGATDGFIGERFTRGLSVADDFVIVGGSDVALRRDQRAGSNGYLWTLTPKLELVGTLMIDGGQVQEIRRTDVHDRAMLGR